MSQLHIHAESSDLADIVLLPGDPNRSKFIAETFFEDPVLYNEYRGLLGYTGTYRGVPVSVQTTGMGCPSLAIVVEELIRLGAKTLIRVGTAGIIAAEVEPGDLIVATASVPMDGTTRMYLGGQPYAPAGDHQVNAALVASARSAGYRPHVGLIQTEDAFYATSPDDVPRLAERGVLAVEMEASALFLLGKLRKVRAGCALVASNRIGDPSFVAPEVLRAAVHRMVETTLDAAVALSEQRA